MTQIEAILALSQKPETIIEQSKDFEALEQFLVDKNLFIVNLPGIGSSLSGLVAKADEKLDSGDLITAQLYYRRILRLGNLFVDTAISWTETKTAVPVIEQFVISANHLAKTNKKLTGITDDIDTIDQLNDEKNMALGKAWEWAHEFGLTHWQWKNLSDSLLGEIQEVLHDKSANSLRKLHKQNLSLCSLVDAATQYINQIEQSIVEINSNNPLSKEEGESKIKKLEEERKSVIGNLIVFTNNRACIEMRLGELHSSSHEKAQEYFENSQKHLEKSLDRAKELLDNPSDNTQEQIKNAFRYPGLASNLAYAHLLNLRAIVGGGRTFEFDNMTPHIEKIDKNLKTAIDFFKDPSHSKRELANELYLRSAYTLLTLKWIELYAESRKMFMPQNFKAAYEKLAYDTILNLDPEVAKDAESLDRSRMLAPLSELLIKKVLAGEEGNMDDEDKAFLQHVIAERLKLYTSTFNSR